MDSILKKGSQRSLTLALALNVLALVIVSCSEKKDSSSGEGQIALPKLHEIKTHTFGAPYSCDGEYRSAGMYLTEANSHSVPEVMLNGSSSPNGGCSGDVYFEPGGGGDNFSLIADLGAIPIESVTASLAMSSDSSRVKNQVAYRSNVPAIEGHTYSVITNYNEVRALTIFTVDKLDPNGQTIIRYAVKSYSVMASLQESEGFDWKTTNLAK